MSNFKRLDESGHAVDEDTNSASPYAPAIPGNVVEHNDGEDHVLTNEETIAVHNVVRTEANTEPRFLDGDKEVQGGPPRVVDTKTEGEPNPGAVEVEGVRDVEAKAKADKVAAAKAARAAKAKAARDAKAKR